MWGGRERLMGVLLPLMDRHGARAPCGDGLSAGKPLQKVVGMMRGRGVSRVA